MPLAAEGNGNGVHGSVVLAPAGGDSAGNRNEVHGIGVPGPAALDPVCNGG